MTMVEVPGGKLLRMLPVSEICRKIPEQDYNVL